MTESKMQVGIFDSGHAFNAVIEHWSKSRIDSALATIARYDDAARQLITIGGALQGLYFAVFTFGNLNEKLTSLWPILLLIPVVLVIFCSAQCVCRVHLSAEAMNAYSLLLKGSNTQIDIQEITTAMEKWCIIIDGIAEQKRQWLHRANQLFVLSTVLTLVTLVTITMT